MKASDAMTRNVFVVRPDTPLAEAVQPMIRNRISGLPVIDQQGRIAGIITEGDLLRRTEIGTERERSGWLSLFISPGRLAEDFVLAHARRVGEVMTTQEIRVVKGAPAVVATVAPMTQTAKSELDRLTRAGYRTIAVAAGQSDFAGTHRVHRVQRSAARGFGAVAD